MKRLALAAVALSMFAMPALEAQAAPSYVPQPIGAQQSDATQVDYRKNDQRRYDGRKYDGRKKFEQERRWKRGQKYSSWKRHRAVNDWNRHGLHRPGRGQQWIRVGNDYLLVGIVSGVIAGMIAAH